MRFLSFSGLTAVTIASAATAADIPVAQFGTVEELRLERADWSGFSGVVIAGGAFLHALSNAETRYDNHEDSAFQRSAVFGAGIGYDHQFGSLILGAHLEGMATNFRTKPSQVLSVNNRWLGSATARLGFDAGRFMPYVSAGIGYGRLQVNHDPQIHGEFDDAERTVGNTVYAKTAQALVLGGGAEARISNGLFLRADYKHFRFGEIEFNLTEPRWGLPTDLVANNRVDVFNLGVGYRF